VSDADGYLTAFNLAPGGVTSTVTIPSTKRVFRGVQISAQDSLQWTVTLEGGTAFVEPPRFTIDGAVPLGTRFDVADSRHLTITAPPGRAVTLTVGAGTWSTRVRVPAGASRAVTAPGSTVTPTEDRARGRTTFPTSPLPAGMNSPSHAVDGDPRTSWRPGPSGRMVVDLGVTVTVSDVRLTWSRGTVREFRLSSSTDGVSYASLPLLTPVPVRYLMVTVPGWRPGDAELIELVVLPAPDRG
jgi:hypothetical protein